MPESPPAVPATDTVADTAATVLDVAPAPASSGDDDGDVGAEPAGGVGICLSGGGLRAASFGLGVLQSLQLDRRILRGPKAARWISAVSGGSYIAGCLTLINAGSRASYTDATPVGGYDLPEDGVPLAQGSPEVAHILNHSRFLVEDGGVKVGIKIAVLLIASAVTFGVLIAWIGMMVIGDLGGLGHAVVSSLGWPLPGEIPAGLSWTIGIVGLASAFGLLRAGRVVIAPAGSGVTVLLRVIGGMVLGLAAVAIGFVSGPYLSGMLAVTPVLMSPTWLTENMAAVLIVAGAIALALTAMHWLGRWRPLHALGVVARSITFIVARALPWIIAILLISWAGVFMYLRFIALFEGSADSATVEADIGVTMAIFGAVLVGGVLVIPIPGLISPHRPYRTLIARCFAVTRTSETTAAPTGRPDQIALSSLAPPVDGISFPELIICAAANITDPGSAPAGSNVLPLTLSPARIEIPTVAGASIPTAELEQMTSPNRGYGIVSKRPMMSLFSAVAIAGAAVSPAMGRHSRPSLRPLLTALNVRLGVWLPNPMSAEARTKSAEAASGTFAVGIDQLLAELLGWHSAKRMLVYASDGGHYDNLGLLPLLRHECTEIWIVDAQANASGRPSQLVEAILLAEAEMGCRFTLDVSVFERRTADGRLAQAHAHGRVRYSSGNEAVVHVLKLGVTDKHSGILQEYELLDRGFPFHPTYQQVFSADRFEAYRRLGEETTEVALAEQESGAS